MKPAGARCKCGAIRGVSVRQQMSAPDKIAIAIMERCHDFIQQWAMGPSMTVENFKEAMEIRVQIDLYLGYCPEYEPEKRRKNE